MNLSEFDYNLPKELIAQYPLPKRDEARLMVVERKTGNIEHRIFRELPGFFRKDDLLVLNDTKVLRCRLKGNRLTGGKVEIFLLGKKDGLTFQAMISPARVREGEKIVFPNTGITCTVTGHNLVSFQAKNEEAVYNLGVIPLPPYIKREAEPLDSEFYQTVYARENGSVASPTAGLHFTGELLDEIKKSGTGIAYVTLHVGEATFRPVKSEEITGHKMGSEFYRISEDTQKKLAAFNRQPRGTPERKGRVFAVGTTSCRTLETFASTGRTEGYTDLFIYPGYEFKIVDCLLTNFHLPKTTLFMLVCALCGQPLAQKAYAEAVSNKYRFYSYGDAMLIL